MNRMMRVTRMYVPLRYGSVFGLYLATVAPFLLHSETTTDMIAHLPEMHLAGLWAFVILAQSAKADDGELARCGLRGSVDSLRPEEPDAGNAAGGSAYGFNT